MINNYSLINPDAPALKGRMAIDKHLEMSALLQIGRLVDLVNDGIWQIWEVPYCIEDYEEDLDEEEDEDEEEEESVDLDDQT